MKFYVYFKEDGTIDYVRSFESYPQHTEKDIIANLEELNKKEDREAYVIFEIDGNLAEVIKFLLGEKGYKRYAKLDTIEDSLNEVICDIQSICDDAYSMSNRVERIEKMFEELKEKFENYD